MNVAASPALPLAEAVEHVAKGGLLGYPTETVWGLGADARSPRAVAQLRAFKGRDADKPLSVLVEGREALATLRAIVPPYAEKLMAAWWPGPLTLVLRCRGALADGVAGPDGALGLRCSTHPVARALAYALRERGVGPLTATSLNRSGEAPARSRAQALALCGGEAAPQLVAGPDAGGAAPSTVVDATGPRAVLLREGAIAADDLVRLLGEIA